MQAARHHEHYALPEAHSLAPDLGPDAGLHSLQVYWQPDPDAPNPERPGRKAHISAFVHCSAGQPCLCGSGKPFQECCRPLPRWRIVCQDYNNQTYSSMRAVTAIFRGIDGDYVEDQLDSDSRLRCVSEDPACRFWLYDGNPC